MSRDVRFIEHLFPFKGNSHAYYMQAMPSPLPGVQTWHDDYLHLSSPLTSSSPLNMDTPTCSNRESDIHSDPELSLIHI